MKSTQHSINPHLSVMRDTTSAPKPLDCGASWLTSSLQGGAAQLVLCSCLARQQAQGAGVCQVLLPTCRSC